MNIQVGLLSDFMTWLWELVRVVWQAFTDFFDDLFLNIVEKVLSGIIFVISLLPFPDFIHQYSFGHLLSQAGPTVLWFAQILQISKCLFVLSSGMIFYFIRRLLTLGIW